MKLPNMVLGPASPAFTGARERPRMTGARGGVVPAQGCVSGAYDTDEVIFASMGPAQLARTRGVSTTCDAHVNAYVTHLVNAGRFQYVSALTAALSPPVNQLTVPQILQGWGTGRLRLV